MLALASSLGDRNVPIESDGLTIGEIHDLPWYGGIHAISGRLECSTTSLSSSGVGSGKLEESISRIICTVIDVNMSTRHGLANGLKRCTNFWRW